MLKQVPTAWELGCNIMKYISIIDDSITIRSAIKLIIKDLGYSLAESSNGKEALQKINEIKQSGDDVVLCIVDINMPVMDGLTFTDEFRKIDEFTPVIVLTTETKEELIEKVKKLGASGWLTKPFKPDDLLKTIKRLVK